MFVAATSGNIELFGTQTNKNPLVLADFALTSPTESLLHVATKDGKIEFVREILKQNPKLVSELSKDGYRPMDIASVLGYIEMVQEFIKIDPRVCRLQGKDQRTALHYAAINGRVQVINEILSACPDCIHDICAGEETSLHLAVKNNQIHAFEVLREWLDKLNLQRMLNYRDCNGNTVLHLAAQRKQLQTIKLLVNKDDWFSKKLEMNAINSKGLTALDVLDIVIEHPDDIHIRQILQRAGALEAQHVTTTNSLGNIGKKNKSSKRKTYCSSDWFEYFKFQKGRDSPNDTRNALLVVAALIATITFQAGVEPPSGILKMANSSTNSSSLDASSTTTSGILNMTNSSTNSTTGTSSKNHLRTNAATFMFLFLNSLGLTSSLSIIIYLTVRFPFQRELQMAMVSMVLSYVVSISSIMDNMKVVTSAIMVVALILPLSLRLMPWWAEKYWERRNQSGSNRYP